jgi:lipopolysaccharide export system permease protein
MFSKILSLTVLDRYLGRLYLSTTLFVSLIFVAVIGVITMITELSALTQGYHFSNALTFVMSEVVNYIYQLFPILSMLGAILALGHLAAGNELIVMRTSGASIKKIMFSISKMVLMLVFFVTLLGEGLAPEVKFMADKMKAQKLNNGQALHTARGTWVRHGNGFTHFDKAMSKHVLLGVTHYKFNGDHELRRSLFAKRATMQNGQWQLFQVAISDLLPGSVKTSHVDSMMFDIGVSVRATQLSKLQPDQQTLSELYKVIKYRSDRDMSTKDYSLNFWQRIAAPLETILLVCLAVPFMMGPLRSATMGLRLMMGVMFGFGFYFTSQFFGPFAIMYPFPAWLAAFLPSILLLLFGQLMLRYVGD